METKDKDVSNMPVQKQRCSTCPFNPGAEPGLRMEIEARLLRASQTCHSTGVVHGREDTMLCRGARDHQLTLFHRFGILSEPTDECWRQTYERLKHV